MINVGCVTYGHSDYHDEVWGWLHKHSELFTNDANDLADCFDWWRSWGLLSLVGCKVESYGYADAPPPYECDYGEGVVITFDGEVSELLRRLDCQV